jgi:hypothetical protein
MNTDYKKPEAYHQSDYRTSSSRVHRFALSTDRNFIPNNTHLCSEQKNSLSHQHRPRSETTREYQWKVNSNRSFREEFAPPINRVHYLHQFTDKIKAVGVNKQLDFFRSRWSDEDGSFTMMPKDVRYPIGIEGILQPTEHICRETHLTSTAGVYPLLDGLVSTTELDFHKHKTYSSSQTNLIVQKELPFNAAVAFFTPNSRKIIKEFPLCKKYDAKIVRDISKFPTADFDRITLMRTKCREMKTEMASNY